MFPCVRRPMLPSFLAWNSVERVDPQKVLQQAIFAYQNRSIAAIHEYCLIAANYNIMIHDHTPWCMVSKPADQQTSRPANEQTSTTQSQHALGGRRFASALRRMRTPIRVA